jgi:CheY-like chemotaxis protein
MSNDTSSNVSRDPLCLVVDDHAHVRLFLFDGLSRAGYRVVTACDGAEALRFARQVPIDIVLVDKQMPGLNGYETAAALRAIDSARQVPMILMTGVPTPDEAAQAAHWGFQAYVEKPFRMADLLALMAQWVGRRV